MARVRNYSISTVSAFSFIHPSPAPSGPPTTTSPPNSGNIGRGVPAIGEARRVQAGLCGGHDVESAGLNDVPLVRIVHVTDAVFYVAEAHDHTTAQIFQARADPRLPLRHSAALAPQLHPMQLGHGQQ